MPIKNTPGSSIDIDIYRSQTTLFTRSKAFPFLLFFLVYYFYTGARGNMSKEDIAHFQSLPWCATLLNDPSHTVTPTVSRTVKPTGEDTLFGETLNSNKTIPACITFYKTPSPSEEYIREVHTLVALRGGLDGYPHVCHGGIIATLLDEAMGVLHSVNKTLLAERAKSRGEKMAERPATVTAGLDVKYLKPVRTPQTVLLTATVDKMEGRKIWITGSIKDEKGVVLSKGGGLFVQIGRANL